MLPSLPGRSCITPAGMPLHCLLTWASWNAPKIATFQSGVLGGGGAGGVGGLGGG